MILAAIIGLRLYLLYWGFIYDGFLVPPGDDAVNHIKIISAFMQGDFRVPGLSYPPLYHLFAAGIAGLFKVSPLSLLTWTGPLLVILPVIAVYFLTRRFFGLTAALIAAALVGLAGAGPIYAYGDGGYPNLIGSSFIMVFVLMYGVLALRESPRRNGAIAIGLLILLALTHHLSFIVFLLVTFGFVLTLLIGHMGFEEPIFNTRVIKKFILPAVAAVTLAGLLLYGKTLIVPILNEVFGSGTASYLNDYLRRPLDFGQYSETVGPLVWLMGSLGLLTLGLIYKQTPWERRWLIIAWAVSLFVFSRLEFGVPARLVRELTVPLAISGGCFGAWLIDQAKTNISKIITTGAIAGLISIHIVMLSIGPFILPEGFRRLVWFWPEDQAKIAFLKLLPKDARIAATPSSPYYEILLPDHHFTVGPLGNNHYLFIGNKPRGNPDGNVYPYFAKFDEIKKSLLKSNLTKVLYTFDDGTVLKEVDLTIP